MKGKRLDYCAICLQRGSGYRRVPYPFQETGHSEQNGVIFLTAFSRIYAPGPVCWRHNYQCAEPAPEQFDLFQGGNHESNDEPLSSTGAV